VILLWVAACGYRQTFREAARQAIETSVIPAYGLMLDYLNRVEPLVNDDVGVWKLPDGEAYYAYMLRRETSTDLTPQEIHRIGLAEVARIHQEMRQALSGPIVGEFCDGIPFTGRIRTLDIWSIGRSSPSCSLYFATLQRQLPDRCGRR
jgi:hypothetical protein